MRRYLFIFIGILILTGISSLVWHETHKELYADLLCPSQYPTADASEAALQTFVNEFYAAHPQASLGDMLTARYNFYLYHHCTKELAAYQQVMNGTANPATMKVINQAIQSATSTL